MTVAINLPFRFSADGGVSATRDIDKQIRQRLISIIGTEPAERVMLPRFGVPVAATVFEPDIGVVEHELSVKTQEQAMVWEPGLNVNTVIPIHDADGRTAIIDVTFSRTDSPNSPTDGARYVHQAVIGPSGIAREVING